MRPGPQGWVTAMSIGSRPCSRSGPGAIPVQGPGAALPGPPGREIRPLGRRGPGQVLGARQGGQGLFIPRSTQRLAVVDENFISRGFGLTTTIVDANRQAVWAVRRASGPQASTTVPWSRRSGLATRSRARRVRRSTPPDHFKALAPGRGRVAAGRGAGAVGRSRHPGRPARRAPRRSQARQQRGLAGGPSPGPGQGLRGGGAGAGARPDAHIRRGIRLMLHSGEASFVPWLQAYTEASWRGGWLHPARAPGSRRQGRCDFFSASTSSNPRSAR